MVIRSRMRRADHVACMGKMKNAYSITIGILDHLEDLGIKGMIILEWILHK
jgi:hypothetical protein